MARVNIDDDVESRPEYRRLLKLVGFDDDKALGMLVRFWRLAQKYWGEHKLVPIEEIENWEFQLIIESRWGIVNPSIDDKWDLVDSEGVYAIGSVERFAWYRQICDAAKKGGRPAKAPKPEKEPERTEDQPKLTEAKPEETGPKPEQTGTAPRFHSENPLVPVPVPVPVLSPVKNIKTKNLKADDAPPGQEVSRFIGTYVKAYQVRYPGKEGRPPPRPDLKGKVQGQIKKYLEEVPIDRACELIQVYCQMDDPWFKTKCHDFTTFAENQNKVSLALDTGENISHGSTRIDWSQVNLS